MDASSFATASLCLDRQKPVCLYVRQTGRDSLDEASAINAQIRLRSRENKGLNLATHSTTQKSMWMGTEGASDSMSLNPQSQQMQIFEYVESGYTDAQTDFPSKRCGQIGGTRRAKLDQEKELVSLDVSSTWALCLMSEHK